MATENSFLEKAGRIQLSGLLSNEDLPCLSTVTNGIVLELALFVLYKILAIQTPSMATEYTSYVVHMS